MPKNFVPKHRQEETKQKYELRLKNCKYRLMQDTEQLQLRADRYTEKFHTIDKDIDILIEMKYNETPSKIDHFKEQWKLKCKNEEIKFRDICCAREKLIRSTLSTFKIYSGSTKEKSDRKNCKGAKNKLMYLEKLVSPTLEHKKEPNSKRTDISKNY